MAESGYDTLSAKIVFRKALPKLSNPLGRESNFTTVTDLLFGEGLIGKNDLDHIKSQKTLTDKQKGSAIVHHLYDSIDSIDDNEQAIKYLIKISDKLEESGDKELKQHALNMKSHFIKTETKDPKDDSIVCGTHDDRSTRITVTATSVLDITDLNKVTTVLREVLFASTRWIDMGLDLGLLMPTLLVIEDTKGDSNNHLRKCIQAWLQQTDNVKPTWRALIEAVKSTGDHAAAGRIPQKLLSLYNIKL